MIHSPGIKVPGCLTMVYRFLFSRAHFTHNGVIDSTPSAVTSLPHAWLAWQAVSLFASNRGSRVRFLQKTFYCSASCLNYSEPDACLCFWLSNYLETISQLTTGGGGDKNWCYVSSSGRPILGFSLFFSPPWNYIIVLRSVQWSCTSCILRHNLIIYS